jgi:hypothetical protein
VDASPGLCLQAAAARLTAAALPRNWRSNVNFGDCDVATLVLSAVGAAAGAVLGPVGAIVGRAIGGIAGALIDETLIRSTQSGKTGPRLSDLTVLSSTEGKAIQQVYGRVRVSGDIIWATQYEEDAVRSSGGKGGPAVQTYDYYANFAVGLCAGPINHVARVWADGVELDLTQVTMRIYSGTRAQSADPLILAVQPGGVPAYRDLAYVVFERLPLSNYGNRIPQLTFEVIRCVDALEARVRAVTLIPGSTEFGYQTTALTSIDATGATVTENRHVQYEASDIDAALDDLQAICPNIERVALVVAWFGDDLRAGNCTVAPRVMSTVRSVSRDWSVAGLNRATARAVSQVAPTLAYGATSATAIAAFDGTPDDASVIAAIAAIRARGLKVTLYPFLLMDILSGNTLPDPYGGSAQGAFPWRGRITCCPAAGQPGTVDKTSAAATQVAAFVGMATQSQFSTTGGAVGFSGTEWSFRRFILHYANLASLAGGVDAILLGSELRGLTTVRSASGAYPFVTALIQLAGDVKSVLGSQTKVSYGADWSEWFGHQPQDGSHDVTFHLDPFWACPDVDFIGIDSYVPLSDWRYGPNLDAGIAPSAKDINYLRANVLAGEGYDFYYASDADRTNQVRTPITDGAYSEPWIFRYKDLPNWWGNLHYNRPGGVRAATPTAWVPRSKSIWLTETGCPAVDLGPNQPNRFPDAYSSEAGLPYFSHGARDDLAQRRFCEAVMSAWDVTDPAHLPAATLTTLSGSPMLDPATIHLWTWDARPFPAFPAFSTVWADAANWRTGHWLTGRLGGTSVDALIRAILADYGFFDLETVAVDGAVDGYLVDTVMTARSAVSPLLTAWQIDPIDTGTSVRFAGRARPSVASYCSNTLVDTGKAPVIELIRKQETELPHEVSVTVSDVLRDYHRSTVTSRRLVGQSATASKADLPIVAPLDVTLDIADQWLHDLWVGRETANFALSPNQVAIEPGDIIDLAVGAAMRSVLVTRITDGLVRTIEARTVYPALYAPASGNVRGQSMQPAVAFGAPTVEVLDIAHLSDTDPFYQPYLAVTANPWPGTLAIWRQSSDGGSYQFIATHDGRATIGMTTQGLGPGPVGVFDRVTTIGVTLLSGSLASVSEASVLAGGNLAAIQNAAGLWEVFQFASALLTAPNSFTLSDLLRAQGGSEDAWLNPTPAGSPFVLLDDTLLAIPITAGDVGLPVTLRIGPASQDYTAASYASVTFTPQARGLLPWSPTDVHGRRDPTSGDVTLTWIRRSRLLGADTWGAGDAPLGEESEAYQLRIQSGTSVVRMVATTAPVYAYTATQQMTDFGALQASYTISVAQVSAALGPGVWRTVTLTL